MTHVTCHLPHQVVDRQPINPMMPRDLMVSQITIGDTSTASEHHRMRDDNLITICYAGGYKGHAVAHVMNHSPEVLDQGDRCETISEYGDVHQIWTRYGYTSYGHFSRIPVSVENVSNHCGVTYDPLDVLPHDVIDAFLAQLPHTYLEIGDRRLPWFDALEMHRVITAEHVSVENQLSLFPNCRCVVLTGDNNTAMRAWSDKFLLRRNRHTGLINMQQKFGESVMTPSRQKALIRQIRDAHTHLTEMNAAHPHAIVVDVDRLFDIKTARTTYLDMCSRLDLTPMWDGVSDFIARYNRSQELRTKRDPQHAPP